MSSYFGKTSIGGTNSNGVADLALFFGPYTAPADGFLTRIEFYCDDYQHNFVLGVYADNSGAPVAGALLGKSTGGVLGGSASNVFEWRGRDLITPVSITSGTKYWLGINSGSGSWNFKYDSASTQPYYYSHTYDGNLTDPFPSAAAFSYEGSIRGAYDTASPPTLSTLTPNNGNKSATVTVAFVGTGFVNGATTVNVPTGITVGAIVFHSSTSIDVDLIIASNCTPGAKNISATTASGTSGNQTFTVNTPSVISLVSPSQLDPGASSSITLTGTGFASAGLTLSFSPPDDLTVSNLTRVDATTITFDLDVGGGAAEGNRPLKITQTVGGDSNSKTFQIGSATAGGGGNCIELGGSGTITL